MKRLIVIIGVLILSIVFGGVSYGATSTAQLQVSATVVSACTVSTSALNFGNVIGGSNPEATGDIIVTCPSMTNYNIALNAGMHYSGGARRLTFGSHWATYTLCKDASCGQLWGDSDYDNTYPDGSSLGGHQGTGSAEHIPVYGVITTLPETIPAGTVLTDTVTVTVHY